MKRNIILGVLLLLAVSGGTMFMNRVSAQKEESESPVESRPESTVAQSVPFTQNWTNIGLITANDDWSGVPGIEGYLGQDITLATGVDPQTLLTTSAVASDMDAIANQAAPDTLTSGGVSEFDTIANPVVALQGSGTADAPYIIFYLNTTGFTNVNVAYNLRDIDGSTDNSIQPVALQYRVGNTGNFTNVAAGFVADASSGPSLATLVTPVSAALGADASNQALVQVRVITSNAVGNDEWIGVDDVNITGTAGGTPAPTPAPKFFFSTRMSGANEAPNPNASTATGYGRVVVNAAQTQITASFYWEGLGSNTTAGHIHTGAVGVAGPVTFNMNPTTGVTRGSTVDVTFPITPAQLADLRAGNMYFNIHTTTFGGGEIRGQLVPNLSDAPLDFNGDGRTDFGVVRQTAGAGGTQARWLNLTNRAAQVETQTDFGLVTDSLTPGDFDGDSKDDIAIWRSAANASTFFILQSNTNTVRYVRFGIPGDDPFVIGDYDGDGVDDPAIYRKGGTNAEQSQFWWFGSFGVARNVQVVVNWGVGGDTAIPGDYNGDGKNDFVVNRTISNRSIFYVHAGTGGFDQTSSADYTVRFGLPTDLVVPGDYDGDRITDIAVYRNENGNVAWYFLPSAGVNDKPRVFWGRDSSDFAVQGDYDGDGKTDYAVWRATPQATYFILRSLDGNAQYQNWGIGTDIPAALDSH